LRREVPFILMIVFAILRALTECILYFDQYKLASGDLLRSMISYGITYMGLAAMLMGMLNVSRVHYNIIRRKRATWIYSICLLIVMYAYAILGLVQTNKGTAYQWIYNSSFVPLDATMFSLLAFYIASASYRAFRVKSMEAFLVLAVAFIAMLAFVPFGELIWPSTAWLGGFNGVKNWILDIPNAASVRGIGLGIYLGSMATNWRVMLGIERRHLGQD